MPREYTLLENAPVPYVNCPVCDTPFEPFMRGLVQRSQSHRCYCALICSHCQKIVGYEEPPKGVDHNSVKAAVRRTVTPVTFWA